MSENQPHVAVVGAGIGGLTAAIALRRAGLRVDVYEQAPVLSEIGAGIHLAPNGSRLLVRLGLGKRLDEVAVRPEAMEVRVWDTGAVVVRQPMGDAWQARFDGPHYTLHRADLHGLLAEAVPADLVHVGHRAVAVTEDPGGVRIDFAHGASVRADVVVAADGVHSPLRRPIAGEEPAVFSKTAAIRAVVPSAACPDLPRDALLTWVGPAGRLLAHPVRGGRETAFVAVVADPTDGGDSWSRPADTVALRRAFAGWEPGARALVEAATEAGHWTLYDREPLPRWSTARTTLLGDAAHPMLPHHGQGASQAIEDAVTLAACLARLGTGPSGPAPALRRYEELRLEHTSRVRQGSLGGGSQRLSPTTEESPASPSRPPSSSPSARPGGAGMEELVRDVTWVQRYDVEAELATAGLA
ncbi:FAD-dependent monooxygenase [Streptomyces sp. NPDC005209]|uniref:FAD-dependent monooxygenase n=1 Tax=Streptomyces sp. NPDC005209 TaxID=3156715 RepID=UPI0033B0D11E